VHLAAHLGGEHDFVALGEVLEGAAEDFLADATCVHVGRVKEVDAEIQRPPDNRAAVLLIQRPRVVGPTFSGPEAHGAEADARDVHAGVAQLCVLHVRFLSVWHCSILILFATETPDYQAGILARLTLPLDVLDCRPLG